MKKTVFYLIILVLLNVFPNSVMASEKKPTPINKTTTEVPDEFKLMLNRLDEIKNMDKSSLDRSEKKELRTEVREIKKTLKASGRGIYLSVGAIIIILLVLLII